MTNEMVRDALNRIAARAEPVDGMAEIALRRAARRRATGMTAIALGTAAVIAAPVLLVAARGGDDDRGERARPAAGTTTPPDRSTKSPSPESTTLEEKKAADRAAAARAGAARACLAGSPIFSEDKKLPLRDTAPPTTDYRILATHSLSVAQIVFLGNEQANRICVLDRLGKPNTADKQTNSSARRWSRPIGPTGDLSGSVSIQNRGHGPLGFGKADLYEFHLAGTVGERVTRLTVSFGGLPPVPATVVDGYFVSGTLIRRDLAPKLTLGPVDVYAYDREGDVIFKDRYPGESG